MVNLNSLEERLKGNILDPLTFEEGEIDVFTRDFRCGICGGHLLGKHTDDRKYTAFCHKHGVIMDHNHVTAYKAEQAKQSATDGKHELRKPMKPRDEETILAELGF